jgi:hypothetical protein
MFLLPFVFIAAIALTIWFIFFTEAPMPAKILVGLLYIATLLLRFSRFSMAGFFLQIALCISLALYQKLKSL